MPVLLIEGNKMAMKTADYVVTHPSLNLAVGGKLQEIPLGTVITLAANAAQSLIDRGMIKPKGADKRVELDNNDPLVK